MLGDLLNFSPCLKILKDNKKDSHISLICSEYNYQIAKNYHFVDKFIIFKKKKFINNIINNFKELFLSDYDYLFQFDGKKSSYLISYFVKAKIRSTICFIKNKSILGFKFKLTRPSKLILKIFFKNYIFCDESYKNNSDQNRPIHYQTNYFNILKKLNMEITNKKNLFFLDKSYKNSYEYFFSNFIIKPFCLFHFDEKWDKYTKKDYENSIRIIENKAKKYKIIITTGIKDFIFFNQISSKYNVFNYINDEFKLERDNNSNILILKNLPLNLLAYFIKNSELNISSHSGPVVHISPTFDRQIIDLIPRSKNDELNRWIPTISKYKRINFEDLNDNIILSI